MYDYNTGFVYVSLAEAQKFFEHPGRVSGIQVRVDDIYNAEEIGRSIQTALGYPYYRGFVRNEQELFLGAEARKNRHVAHSRGDHHCCLIQYHRHPYHDRHEKSREIAILKSMGSLCPQHHADLHVRRAGHRYRRPSARLLGYGAVAVKPRGPGHHAAQGRLSGESFTVVHHGAGCSVYLAYCIGDQLYGYALSVMAGENRTRLRS